MFYINDAKFVKVWEVEDKGNYAKMKVSTTDKDKDGNKEYTNWFAMVVGKAYEVAKTLNEGDVITVKGGKISNPYNKEHKKSFLNVVFWDIEATEQSTPKPASEFQSFDDDFGDFNIADQDLPFD